MTHIEARGCTEMWEGKNHKYFSYFKITLFFICFSCLTYQEIEFLNLYYSYPEVLDMFIETGREIVAPAATFCLTESISRKRFCHKYPYLCVDVKKNESICKEFPNHCMDSGNSTKVLQEKDIDFTFEDLTTLGSNITDYLLTPSFESPYYKEHFEGPVYFGDYFKRVVLKCYTFNVHTNSNKDPFRIRLNQADRRKMSEYGLFRMMFEIRYGDLFKPLPMPGILFHVHSPFEPVNPTKEGVFMKPGWEYKLRVQLEEEHLLKAPYKSDCTNYTSLWKNNKTSSFSQKVCMNNCEKAFDCRIKEKPPLWAEYPIKEGICGNRSWPTDGNEEEETVQYNSCLSECKADCLKYRFPYIVQERDVFVIRRGKQKIRVVVVLDDPQVLVTKHKPQYEGEELFSYIGGFTGLWLGISFFTFGDIVKYTYVYAKKWYCRVKHRKIFHILFHRSPSDTSTVELKSSSCKVNV